MVSSAFGKRQRARIMITVKAYSELPNKYRETTAWPASAWTRANRSACGSSRSLFGC